MRTASAQLASVATASHCLSQVFEFITSRGLFNPVGRPGWTEEHDLMARYMTNTGQLFPVTMLRQSSRVAKYFDPAEFEKHGGETLSVLRKEALC